MHYSKLKVAILYAEGASIFI